MSNNLEVQDANTGSVIYHQVRVHQSISVALREVIYLQQMIREMRRQGIEFEETQPKAHCKTFEDNSGAFEMANIHKLRPGPSISQQELAITFAILLWMVTSLSYL